MGGWTGAAGSYNGSYFTYGNASIALTSGDVASVYATLTSENMDAIRQMVKEELSKTSALHQALDKLHQLKDDMQVDVEQCTELYGQSLKDDYALLVEAIALMEGK